MAGGDWAMRNTLFLLVAGCVCFIISAAAATINSFWSIWAGQFCLFGCVLWSRRCHFPNRGEING